MRYIPSPLAVLCTVRLMAFTFEGDVREGTSDLSQDQRFKDKTQRHTLADFRSSAPPRGESNYCDAVRIRLLAYWGARAEDG